MNEPPDNQASDAQVPTEYVPEPLQTITCECPNASFLLKSLIHFPRSFPRQSSARNRCILPFHALSYPLSPLRLAPTPPPLPSTPPLLLPSLARCLPITANANRVSNPQNPELSVAKSRDQPVPEKSPKSVLPRSSAVARRREPRRSRRPAWAHLTGTPQPRRGGVRREPEKNSVGAIHNVNQYIGVRANLQLLRHLTHQLCRFFGLA